MLVIIRKLNDIIAPRDKIKLTAIFFLMIVAGLAEAVSIGILAGFVAVVANPDILLGTERIRSLLGSMGIETQQDILIYGAGFLIIIFLIKNSYLIAFRFIKNKFIYGQYRKISSRLFNIYMRVPYSFYLTRNSAEIVRNITTETTLLASHVMLPCLEIATEATITVGLIILLFAVEPVVSLFTLFGLSGVGFFFLKLTRKNIRGYGKKTLKERAEVIKVVNEGVGGFVDATILGRQGWFIERFKKSAGTLSKAMVYAGTTKKSIQPITETIAVMAIFLMSFVFLKQGHSIASLASMLTLFGLSLRRLLPAVNLIINDYTGLLYYSYSVGPIHKDMILLSEHEETGKRTQTEKIHLEDKIRIQNVSYIYPNCRDTALKDITMSIQKGTAVGFVGATGSGKTTIVSLILGLLEPTKGDIFLDGKNMRENLSAWQQNIGYISQSIYLSDDTIANNIAFGLDRETIDQDKLKKAIEVSQLEDFINDLPDKCNTVIGERGIRLSGGQRQRIGIARALYNSPEVLIMDEATSSLDNVTEKFLVQAIERLRKKHTVIIVAHRITTVKNCESIYLFEKGKVSAHGSYEQLIESSQKFKELTMDG